MFLNFNSKKIDDSRSNINSTYSFIYKLFKNGYISKDDLYKKIESIKIWSIELISWFLQEISDIRPSLLNELQSQTNQIDLKSYLKSFIPDKIEQYKLMRDSDEPPDELTKALRNDDVITFQNIISNRNDKINDNFIFPNIFENFIDINNTKYINYAVSYGSINCFNYLLLNHHELDSTSFSYAVYGGNIEIIKNR